MPGSKKGWICEIGLLIYPDCQLSAIYGLTDLFRIAGEWADGDDPRKIRVTHWRAEDRGEPKCVWDTHPNQTHHLDYVITPPSIVMPDKMQPMPQEAAWLHAQHEEGSRVCSICAGAFVLAESGLLRGRRVTTHWAFAKHLAENYREIEVADRNLVLDDGDVISAGGILAWTDLGLTLVERLFGRSTMLSTARFLVIQPPRATQLPFTEFIPDFDHGDEAILRVQHHIHADLNASLTLNDLSELAHLGRRTFMRPVCKSDFAQPDRVHPAGPRRQSARYPGTDQPSPGSDRVGGRVQGPFCLQQDFSAYFWCISLGLSTPIRCRSNATIVVNHLQKAAIGVSETEPGLHDCGCKLKR